MNFRNMMILTTVSAFTFGAGFVVVPVSLASIFGLTMSPTAELIARLYGVALIGIGLLAWLVQNSQDDAIQKPLLLSLFITDFGGFVFMLVAQLSGLMNPLGWSVVGILGLLSAGYAYLRFIK
jgi:hypothetical protein